MSLQNDASHNFVFSSGKQSVFNVSFCELLRYSINTLIINEILQQLFFGVNYPDAAVGQDCSLIYYVV